MPPSAPAPDAVLTYRLLTGPDDDVFCLRVSTALALGYELHGSPTVTCDGERTIVAQALVWPAPRDPAGVRDRSAGTRPAAC